MVLWQHLRHSGNARKPGFDLSGTQSRSIGNGGSIFQERFFDISGTGRSGYPAQSRESRSLRRALTYLT